MMTGLALITDKAQIMSVLSHPAIWPNIAPDHIEPSAFDPPLEGVEYWGVFDKDLMGLFILHYDGQGMQIHANMLPEGRGDIAQEAGTLVSDYARDRYGYVYALIPEKYDNVYQFALRCGMQDGGLIGEDHYVYKGERRWDS
jgi:hypothetical protein